MRFCSLAHNAISVVPDLTGLAALRFVDLSDNRVDDFEPELLPLQLHALRLRHNPCSAHPAYQHHLLAALPYLTVSERHTTRSLPLALLRACAGPVLTGRRVSVSVCLCSCWTTKP